MSEGAADTPAAQITTRRQFEGWLRHAGWSRAAARGIAAHGFREAAGDVHGELLAALRKNIELLSEEVDHDEFGERACDGDGSACGADDGGDHRTDGADRDGLQR